MQIAVVKGCIGVNDRLHFVVVFYHPQPHRYFIQKGVKIVAIGDRYGAIGNPAGIDICALLQHTAAGKLLTKTAQVRMVGNSVSPLPMPVWPTPPSTPETFTRDADLPICGTAGPDSRVRDAVL